MIRPRTPVPTQPQQRTSAFDRPSVQSVKVVKFRSIWQSIWHWWQLELQSSRDPKIWHTVDRSGNLWWHAYNPATGYFTTRESELEILEWIDQRAIDE